MIYLDTSVLVAYLANEPTAETIERWYERNDTGLLVTSDWCLTEFSSALGLKLRTRQISARQAKAIQKNFDIFIDGGLRMLTVSRPAFQHSAILVQTMPGLRAGDALHLAAALEAKVKEFATLDQLLADKARQLGMQLVEFRV